jgi:hypothetical protein
MRLPATVASTTASAIPTVPAAASATTATTASSSTASTTAKAASTPASASTTASAFAGRPSFVDDDVAAHEIVAVKSLNGAFGFIVAIDLDKSESARLPRKTVAHQGNVGRGHSRLRK